MSTKHQIEIRKQNFVAHHYRALFWIQRDTLIVSDTHFGKINHFRKAGIGLPPDAAMDNFERLSSLLLDFKPSRLLFLGDLFHSTMNQDWHTFIEFRATFLHIDFCLIVGNHDIMDVDVYTNAGLILSTELEEDGFIFTHYPIDKPDLYNFHGHVHPGIRLVGHGMQTLRLPCFLFSDENAILPSFGVFTGLHILKPKKTDRIFVITKEEILKIAI